MTITNAVKALERAGFTVSHDALSRWGYPIEYVARRPEAPRNAQVIEFVRNGGDSDEVATIRVRRESDRDDAQTDYYCAGSFCRSMRQAIQWATR